MQSESESNTLKGQDDFYSISKTGPFNHSVYDCHRNEVFSFHERVFKTIKGMYRFCGRLTSAQTSDIEVSILRNVVGNGGSMEIKQFKHECHVTSYHQAIADVPIKKFFISQKINSSDIQLEGDNEKFTWNATSRALFKIMPGSRILAAKVEDTEPNSESLTISIHQQIIQPYIAICFLFLKGF